MTIEPKEKHTVYKAATWITAALLAGLLLALVFTLGYVSSGGAGAGGGTAVEEREADASADGNSAANADTLNEIVDILTRDYVDRDQLSKQQLFEAAIDGLVSSLDDTGTFYIDPTSYQISVGPQGSFEGIGATVSQQNNEIVIVAPFENSPAAQAGVQAGDVILAVDGESTAGWTVDKAVLKIRGPKGTDVTLSVRHDDGTTEDITITRAQIEVESVSTRPPGGTLRDAEGNDVSDLLYVHITEFTQRTPEELEPIVREAEASGMGGIIIDLRGNPGGLLQETVDTADLFLDGGTILIEVDREGKEKYYNARPGGAALTIPIVILQNEFSASGSEVLASALRDNGRATIVGETSFGKGTVNVPRELPDGGALFVTIARWLTPEGILIDGVGIRPDVEAALPPGPYEPETDTQLQRAIDHLHNLQASAVPAPSSAAR